MTMEAGYKSLTDVKILLQFSSNDLDFNNIPYLEIGNYAWI